MCAGHSSILRCSESERSLEWRRSPPQSQPLRCTPAHACRAFSGTFGSHREQSASSSESTSATRSDLSTDSLLRHLHGRRCNRGIRWYLLRDSRRHHLRDLLFERSRRCAVNLSGVSALLVSVSGKSGLEDGTGATSCLRRRHERNRDGIAVRVRPTEWIVAAIQPCRDGLVIEGSRHYELPIALGARCLVAIGNRHFQHRVARCYRGEHEI